MEARDVLYAAVGAPVVVGRKMGERVADWRERMSQETNSYGKSAEKAIESWAAEGRKLIDQIGRGNVDLDQAKEQVGKLRDQLEDMLDTWRASFRPEKIETSPAKQPAKAPAKKPSADKPAAKKPEATKSTDAKAAKPAAKAAKPATAKKPAPKSPSKTDTTKSA